MASTAELLFFDTFSHETSEELNLDLVQFPKPVFISEVRIIPLGARVQADFPGGVRLGATNPSQFEIEFFVNDLSKPGASTFESLGEFEYKQNVNIQLECDRKIPTDGLVLRGWYTTITLAVYGMLTKTVQDSSGHPPAVLVPQAIPTTDAARPESVSQDNTSDGTEWSQHRANVEELSTPREANYMDTTDHYVNTYTSESYHEPNVVYPPYQEEWQVQEHIRPASEDGHSGSYDTESSWDGVSNADDKHNWEHERGRQSRSSRERDHEDMREHVQIRTTVRKWGSDRMESEHRRGNTLRRIHPLPEPGRERESSWPARDRSPSEREDRKRPHSPPVQSPKRPRTPPHPHNIGDKLVQSQRWPSDVGEPGGEMKKDMTAPGQQKYDSLSPGDVESISEGEIPETEVEAENESGRIKIRHAKDVNTVVISVDKKDQPTPPPPPSPPSESMVVQIAQKDVHKNVIQVVEPADVGTPTTSPVPRDNSTPDVEQFEPILSDEDIVDETDPQFQDMEYEFPEESDEFVKTFNPFSCELQPLKYLCLDECRRGIQDANGQALAEELKELLFGQEKTEDWVQCIEQVPSVLMGLYYIEDKQDVIRTLLEWVDTGLDFTLAMEQSQPGYKVRHIKAGVRLVEALCNCGEDIIENLVNKSSAHVKLLSLFQAEHMALSIKLIIIRALDAILSHHTAVQAFLHHSDGYCRLLDIVQSKLTSRVKLAVNHLVRKLHVYETLERMHECCKKLVSGLELSENELDDVTNCFEEVIRIYDNAEVLIAQPKSFLPVQSQYDISSNWYDPYPSLYSYFEAHKLLETCIALSTNPITVESSLIIGPLQELLNAFLDNDHGLEFLGKNTKFSSMILRILLAGEDTQSLGLIMAYRLHVLHHIDALFCLVNKDQRDPDSTEVLEHLYGLYSLTFVPLGKAAFVYVCSRGDYAHVFMSLLSATRTATSSVKESPGRGYIFDLLYMIVTLSDYVPFIKSYGKKILDLASRDEQFINSGKFAELNSWLKPFESPSIFSYEDITALTDILKRYVDNAAALPGELVMAVRILRYLGVPPRDEDLMSETVNVNKEGYVQLKYKFVIIQLFSLDGLSNLVSILQKVCNAHEQPALHSTSFVGSHGAAVISLVLPCMQLLRRMLTYVIHSRNTDFKDLTTIPVLLQTYTLLHAFPPSSSSYVDSQTACRDIVETLLAYTQPIPQETESDSDTLNKSLWTTMILEVVKYTTTGPHTFVSGLLVLYELLPLPLPVQTRSPLPEVESLRIVNARKLWSAHLHSIGSSLQELVATMSGSSFQPLLQLLRRVCVQLADLAAPTALTVGCGVLDTVTNSLPKIDEGKAVCTGHSARLLNFLAYLVTHAPIKCAILQLVSEDRYPQLIPTICAILCSPCDTPSQIQAQECIVSVFQSLCDTEITLSPPPGATVGIPSATQEVYLSNALPQKDLLTTVCTVLLEHVSNMDHNFTTLLPTMRTFLMLTEHDYGFYYLCSCLDKKPDALWSLFEKFCEGFSKDSSDCLSTLSTSLELLRVLVSPEEDDEISRSAVLTVQELATALGWHRSKEDKPHPVVSLRKLLQDCSSEEEALESLYANVAGLVRLLEEEGGKSGGGESTESEETTRVEPVLPPPEPLITQFASRPVFVVGEVDEERLTSAYWLSPPPVDEADQDMDQVGCDLLELARQNLPEYNLVAEIEKICRQPRSAAADEEEEDQLKKRCEDMSKYVPSDSKIKRPFVTPMRGRGFGRSTPQRGDVFRSRPPNTSRPPSLHVDDFVALEITGQQPTGPTGYNLISMRAAKDLISTRSRGRGRGFGSERGRFFGSATPYARRENSRGVPRGSMTPSWSQHIGDGPSQVVPGGRFGAGRATRGLGPGNWAAKDRTRGIMRRDRHIRSFTR